MKVLLKMLLRMSSLEILGDSATIVDKTAMNI